MHGIRMTMEVDCVFYCCARCHGLFATSTDLQNHDSATCDGSMAGASEARMFAVTPKEMSLLQRIRQDSAQEDVTHQVQIDDTASGTHLESSQNDTSFIIEIEPLPTKQNEMTLEQNLGQTNNIPTTDETSDPNLVDGTSEAVPQVDKPNDALTSPENSVRKSRRIAARGRASLVMVGDKIVFSGGRKRKSKEDKAASPKKKRTKEAVNTSKCNSDVENVAASPPPSPPPGNNDESDHETDSKEVIPKQEIPSATDDSVCTRCMPDEGVTPKEELSDIKVEKTEEEFIPIRRRDKKPASTTAKDWKAIHEKLAEKYQAYVKANTETMNSDKSKAGKAVYQCPFCTWHSTMVGFFDRHMTTKHGETGSFICTYCDSVFSERPAYNRHMKVHEKSFICETCAERFTCSKDLQRHMWKHTGEKPFKCDQCEFSTRFKERLKIHKRLHTGERLYCDIEGCTFSTRHETGLKQHKDGTHGLGKKLFCSICPYTTYSAGCMTSHTRQHQGVKNFQCSVCGYRAITKQMVLKHLRTKHSTDKPYKCDQCDYRTAHTTSFRMHIMTHLGIKPFQCTKCGYHSVAKQKVIRHITTRQACQGAQVLAVDTKVKIDWSKYRVPENGASAPEINGDESMVFDLENTGIIMSDEVMEGSEVITMVMPDDCNSVEAQQQYLQQGYTPIEGTDIQTITFADNATPGMYSVMDKVIIIDTPNTTDVQEVLIETQPS